MLLLLKIVLGPGAGGECDVGLPTWGLRIGGVLTALPMVAGPTLIFYAIGQGVLCRVRADIATDALDW